MSFKCTPQVMGLVRGTPKKGQKHRANGRAFFAEFGSERITQSDTYDKDRSYMNKYDYAEGLSSSGFHCWDYIENDADEYRTHIKTKNGKEFDRKLKGDAVVGYALIFNPPEDECVNWTPADYDKFFEDSWDFMKQLEPRLFRDENLVLQAEHADEGADALGNSKHKHIGGFAKDADGKYCGNLIDAKLFVKINETYPAFMRQRGWDMEDLDTTDWKKYKENSEYRAERKEKRKQNGLSVNKYMSRKSAKEAEQEAYEIADIVDLVESVQQTVKDVEEREEDISMRETALDDAEKALKQREKNIAVKESRLDSRELKLDVRDTSITEREKTHSRDVMAFRNEKQSFELKKKEQEQKEADFQVKEDALEAQQRALNTERQQFDLEREQFEQYKQKYATYIENGKRYAQMRANQQTASAYDSVQEQEQQQRRNRDLPEIDWS